MNNKNSLWWRALVCIVCMFLLSGCDFLKSPPEEREFFTDDNGTEYYIVNKNHFTFDGYNVLEVIVSDSEKFILYDTQKDDSESGIGEWIKDGVSYPIGFTDYDRDHLSGKHANIVITPNEYYENYWQISDRQGMPPVIAMINNDTQNPGLYRWSNGAYPYNWEFEDTKVPVQYRTYTRDDLNDIFYIPQKAAQFYSLESEKTSFVSDELHLSFDGKTGKGFWMLNGVEIPVIASFDQSQFAFSVRYNTPDERQGVLIFSGMGTSVNDMTDHSATFVLSSFPQNCGYEANMIVTIQKMIE